MPAPTNDPPSPLHRYKLLRQLSRDALATTWVACTPESSKELVDALVELAGRGKLPVGKTAEAVIEAAQAQATEVIDLDHVEARILARLIQADPPEEP